MIKIIRENVCFLVEIKQTKKTMHVDLSIHVKHDAVVFIASLECSLARGDTRQNYKEVL